MGALMSKQVGQLFWNAEEQIKTEFGVMADILERANVPHLVDRSNVDTAGRVEEVTYPRIHLFRREGLEIVYTGVSLAFYPNGDLIGLVTAGGEA
jgi:hypothetical protein